MEGYRELRFEALPDGAGRRAISTTSVYVVDRTHVGELSVKEKALRWIHTSIEHAAGITHLDCSYNWLESLPSEITRLQNLEHLDCSNNLISRLHDPCGFHGTRDHEGTIFRLPRGQIYWPKLAKLHCANNSLDELPIEIGHLRALEELDLSHNEFKSLPDGVYELTCLKRLDCSYNKLQELSTGVENLEQLEYLDCSNNALTVLPLVLTGLLRLTYLDCSVNKLSMLHEAYPDDDTRQILRNYKPESIALVREARYWPELATLRCSFNELTSLPPEIGALLSLTVLSFGKNRVQALPDQFFKLTGLKELDFSKNLVSMLSVKMSAFKNLEKLDCSSNRIHSLPFRCDSFSFLKEFNCSMNALGRLPQGIGSMRRLEYLDCSNNSINALPTSVQGLATLKIWNCCSNKIQSLTPGVINLIQRNPDCRLVLAKNPVFAGYVKCCKRGFLPSGTVGLTITSAGEISTIARVHEAKAQAVVCSPDTMTFLLENFGGELDFSKCRLQRVPFEVFEFKKITKLSLRDSALVALPAEIGQCQALKKLDLTNNDALRRLPPAVKECTELEQVVIQGCGYATDLYESLDKHVRDSNGSVKWEGKPPTTPKVCLKFLVCTTLLSMSIFVIERLLENPTPPTCQSMCNETSLAGKPSWLTTAGMSFSECVGECETLRYFREKEVEDDRGLSVFQDIAAGVSIVLLLPHIADVGNMMDQRITSGNEDDSRLYSLLKMQEGLSKRISRREIFSYNIFGILIAISNVLCCFLCLRPWNLDLKQLTVDGSFRPINSLQARLYQCCGFNEGDQNSGKKSWQKQESFNVHSWWTSQITFALTTVGLSAEHEKVLKLELECPELLSREYGDKYKEAYGAEPKENRNIWPLIKFIGCMFIMLIGTILALAVVPLVNACKHWKWLFVVLTEWVDTIQSLLLLPLSVVVIRSSDSFGDVIVNLVAVSAFARLDDEVVELFMKPQQSLVERWRLYTGSVEDLTASGELKVEMPQESPETVDPQALEIV